MGNTDNQQVKEIDTNYTLQWKKWIDGWGKSLWEVNV